MICPHCHKTIEKDQYELVNFRGWGATVRVHPECVKVSPIQPVEKDEE